MGDQLETSMSGLWGLATVTKVWRVDDDVNHGYVFESVYENGYQAGETFWPDGTVNGYQTDERMNRSLMPLEYVYKTGKDFDWNRYGEDVSAQKAIANSFVTKFDDYRREGRGLYIFSKTKGSGKTMLACCLANEVLKKYDLSVKFVTVADYAELVKQKDTGSIEKRELIMDAGLLILDDIGSQTENKEWIETALFRLVDRRYSNHFPTIFTSNLRMEELKSDDRIASRIYGVSIPVIIPEVSIRKQTADRFKRGFLQRVLKQGNTAEGAKDE